MSQHVTGQFFRLQTLEHRTLLAAVKKQNITSFRLKAKSQSEQEKGCVWNNHGRSYVPVFNLCDFTGFSNALFIMCSDTQLYWSGQLPSSGLAIDTKYSASPALCFWTGSSWCQQQSRKRRHGKVPDYITWNIWSVLLTCHCFNHHCAYVL